jgi:hypothetical protein
MPISISLPKLTRILGVVFVVLVVASFCAEYARYPLEIDSALIDKFSLNEEQNFPTWWSSFLLLACAFVLWAIAAVTPPGPGRYKRHWTVLGAIFCYMSIDEFAEVHECLATMPGLNDLHGIWYYGWVVPAVVLVAVFALSYLRFLFHLPMKTRTKVAVAGVVYVGGALGVELILGAFTDKHGNENFTWAMIGMVEESMEIVGSSLFLYALLEYLGGVAPDLRIAIRSRA